MSWANLIKIVWRGTGTVFIWSFFPCPLTAIILVTSTLPSNAKGKQLCRHQGTVMKKIGGTRPEIWSQTFVFLHITQILHAIYSISRPPDVWQRVLFALVLNFSNFIYQTTEQPLSIAHQRLGPGPTWNIHMMAISPIHPLFCTRVKKCKIWSWFSTAVTFISSRVGLSVSLTSHQTHYGSYQGQVFTSQKTQRTVSKHWRKIGS